MSSPLGTNDIGFTELDRAIGAVIGSAVGDAYHRRGEELAYDIDAASHARSH